MKNDNEPYFNLIESTYEKSKQRNQKAIKTFLQKHNHPTSTIILDTSDNANALLSNKSYIVTKP